MRTDDPLWPPPPPKDPKLKELEKFIKNDKYAASVQSVEEYRQLLLKLLN